VTVLTAHWRGLLLGLLLVAGVGCDSGGSRQEAQYQRLVGTWEVLDLRQGRFVLCGECAVELTFREGERRAYRLRHAPAEGDTSTVSGRVEVLGENTLSLSEGFSRPLVWTFTFNEPDELNDSVRLQLASRWEGSAQAFLSVIGRSGTSQPVEIDLEHSQ